MVINTTNKSVDVYLYTAVKSENELVGFLKGLEIEFNYAIIEHFDKVAFEKYNIDLITRKDWLNRGRLFNNGQELRWRRLDGQFIISLVSESVLSDNRILFNDETKVGPLFKLENNIYLLGKRLEFNGESIWAEERLLRPLHYPCEADGDYCLIETVNYLDDEGRVVLNRFTGLMSRKEAKYLAK